MGTLLPTGSNDDDSLSEYTDNEKSAPTELLAEFLTSIMKKDYANALKYCKLSKKILHVILIFHGLLLSCRFSLLFYYVYLEQFWIMSPITRQRRIFILSSRQKSMSKMFRRTAMEVMRIVTTHRRLTMSIMRFSITILMLTITHIVLLSRRVSHRTMKILSPDRQNYPHVTKLIPMNVKICSFQSHTAAANVAIRQNLTNFQNPCLVPQRPTAVAIRAILSHSPVCFLMIRTKLLSHPLSLLQIICQVQVRTYIRPHHHLSPRKSSNCSNENRETVVRNFQNF